MAADVSLIHNRRRDRIICVYDRFSCSRCTWRYTVIPSLEYSPPYPPLTPLTSTPTPSPLPPSPLLLFVRFFFYFLLLLPLLLLFFFLFSFFLSDNFGLYL